VNANTKLTDPQLTAFCRLSSEWKTPYQLGRGVRIGSLDALVRRGLAEVKHEIGSTAFLHTSTFYRLKRGAALK